MFFERDVSLHRRRNAFERARHSVDRIRPHFGGLPLGGIPIVPERTFYFGVGAGVTRDRLDASTEGPELTLQLQLEATVTLERILSGKSKKKKNGHLRS